MSVGYNPKIVTDGLVLALDAANVKSYPGSGTTWTDLSTNAYNGTLNGGPTFNADNGGSIVFDGINDYVRVSNIFPMTGISTYTVSIWINIDSTMTGIDCRFFWHGNYGVMIFKYTDDTIGMYMHNATVGVIAYSGAIQFNTWMNITGTYDGSVVKNYINGQFVAQQNLTGTLEAPNTTTLFSLGAQADSAVFWTKCKISNVTVYKNRALTSEEIQQNFNALRGRFDI